MLQYSHFSTLFSHQVRSSQIKSAMSLLPEPELEWYATPISPCIKKTTNSKSMNSGECQVHIIIMCVSTLVNTVVLLSSVKTKGGSEQESTLITLIVKIEDLDKNMEKLIERVERLERAVVRLQNSKKELPPPLPPRNVTIPPTITQDVSLQISPGFLVPAKLTDL